VRGGNGGFAYEEIAPLTPSKDRGSKSDRTLYDNRLCELRETKAPTALIEIDFHTNQKAALWIIENTQLVGYAVARAICRCCDVLFQHQRL